MKEADPCGRIREDCAALASLIPAVEVAITPGTGLTPPPARSEIRHSPSPARPPWQAQAAYALIQAHHEARWLRASLRAMALQVPRQARFSPGRRPQCDLLAIPALAAHPRCEGERPQAALKVSGWLTQARLALGIDDPWLLLPREEGRPPWRCPFCRLPSLRMAPARGLVRCVSPACRDEEGRRPRARAVPVEDRQHKGSWYWAMQWQDGTLHALAPEQAAHAAAAGA